MARLEAGDQIGMSQVIAGGGKNLRYSQASTLKEAGESQPNSPFATNSKSITFDLSNFS